MLVAEAVVPAALLVELLESEVKQLPDGGQIAGKPVFLARKLGDQEVAVVTVNRA